MSLDVDIDTEQSTVTVQAKLIGNMLYFWDCTLDVSELTRHVYLTKCLILEQAVVEETAPTAQFPYGIAVHFPSVDGTMEQFYLSTFSDEDRTEWIEAITNATCELAKFQMRLVRMGIVCMHQTTGRIKNFKKFCYENSQLEKVKEGTKSIFFRS